MIIYIMGPSGSGKDTIYKELLDIFKDKLEPIVQYTSRPIRSGETNGIEYLFTNNQRIRQYEEEDKLIEKREYNTVKGLWTYATIDDGKCFVPDKDYIGIGTLESLIQIRKYFGEENIIPFYLDVDPSIRIQRVVDREACGNHAYDEMCRRWLQDSKDFSHENIKVINPIIVYNNGDLNWAILYMTKIIIKNI